MTRRTKRKADTRGPLQRLHDRAEVERQQSELSVITEAQRLKGTYQGERRIINRGGTPVMRWIHANKLTETQALAITHCYRLWAICGTNQRVTASYGENIASEAYESAERANLVSDAMEDLRRIENYVPRQYWAIFQNVCRFDEPAGVAGSKLGSSRGAEDRAHTIVCFVADLIAMNERLVPNVRIIAA